MRFASVGLFFAAAVSCISLTAFAEEPTDADAASLAGTYRFVSGEKYGGEEPAENLKQSKVSITAGEIIATDQDNKRSYVATYKLDTTKKPWRISMESIVPTIGAKAEGLVSKDGDTLKLIYALPGGDLPTEFKTKEKQLMWVLKADKKPGDN
jgi:uncharacterized protein (TIGR03067 family)